MSIFVKLSAFLALAALVASAPTPSSASGPKVDDVGILKCSLAATGTLRLVPANPDASTVPLGLSDSTRVLNKFGDDDAHAAVEFYRCSDSKFMGYTNSATKMYGYLRSQSSPVCLVAQLGSNGSATFVEPDSRKCSMSDDSSQLAQYFSYEPHGNDQPIIKYVGHRKADSFAGNQYRYAFTPQGQVIAHEEGNDGSHLSFH